MKAKITIEQNEVIEMIKRANPHLNNVTVEVVRGYQDGGMYGAGSPDTFRINATIDVDVDLIGVKK